MYTLIIFEKIRHKEKAPIKYQEMEQKLRADPRLNLSGIK
jgi:hypothetical protein